MRSSAAIDCFVAACRSDDRVLAAFLSGSHATGTQDVHSDIDLGLITTDAAYDHFMATRAEFIEQLGKPLFLEDFGHPQTVFFILSDGTEGELAIAQESSFTHVVKGPHRVLLDKKEILVGRTFTGEQPCADLQQEVVRRLIVWFWHDLSHLLTAVHRRQPLWAHGQLETLRRSCIGLALLARDPDNSNAASDPYFKVDQALAPAHLASISRSVSQLDPQRLLSGARILVDLFCELAKPLAAAYGVTYPSELERLMRDRLASIGSSA